MVASNESAKKRGPAGITDLCHGLVVQVHEAAMQGVDDDGIVGCRQKPAADGPIGARRIVGKEVGRGRYGVDPGVQRAPCTTGLRPPTHRRIFGANKHGLYRTDMATWAAGRQQPRASLSLPTASFRQAYVCATTGYVRATSQRSAGRRRARYPILGASTSIARAVRGVSSAG